MRLQNHNGSTLAKPHIVSAEGTTVVLETVDECPAWRVMVDYPKDFQEAEYSIDFSLFCMSNGALIACWLRLYDIPIQPYFVHRVLDIFDEVVVEYLTQVDLNERILLILENQFGESLTQRIAVADQILDLLVSGQRHLQQIGEQELGTALDDFTSVFDKELGESFDVGKAWQHVRNALK